MQRKLIYKSEGSKCFIWRGLTPSHYLVRVNMNKKDGTQIQLQFYTTPLEILKLLITQSRTNCLMVIGNPCWHPAALPPLEPVT